MCNRFDTCGLVRVMLAAMMLVGNTLMIAIAADDDVAKGKALYTQRCAPCHGADGKAQTTTAQALKPKPRDHTDGAYMNALSHDHLCNVIKQGGTAVGKSPIMPPQADLDSAQIVDIIAFMRSLADPPYPEDIATKCEFKTTN